MPEPRILLWDIETTHNLVAAFSLKNDDYIPHDNIVQERYVVCAAWKWWGESTVHAVSTLNDPRRYKRNPHDDHHVITTLHRVLSEADVIVAHYGDAFDIKYTAGRILALGLTPLPPIPSIDTWKVAKGRFLLNSNKLDYLGSLLGVGRKKPTMTGLWLRVLKGDKQAIREMVAYNKQDVLLLERVFKKLQPYVPNHISRHLFGDIGCPRCGSLKVQARGVHRAISRTYQKYQCRACGGWFRDMKPMNGGDTTRVL
jgi:hypothetical protein